MFENPIEIWYYKLTRHIATLQLLLLFALKFLEAFLIDLICAVDNLGRVFDHFTHLHLLYVTEQVLAHFKHWLDLFVKFLLHFGHFIANFCLESLE